MPRKSKRTKSKRNVNAIGSSSQQSQPRTSPLLKSPDKSEKDPIDGYLAYHHKLSAMNYSHCSFLPPTPFNCKPEQELNLPLALQHRLKTTKSNSIKISSPRRRSSGKASSYSGGSTKRATVARSTHATHTHVQQHLTRKPETAATRKPSGASAKHEKFESQILSSSAKERNELRAKIERYEKSAEKRAITTLTTTATRPKAHSKELLHAGKKLEYRENKFNLEKYKADKTAAALAVAVSEAATAAATAMAFQPTSNEKLSQNIGAIMGWEQVKSNGNRSSRPSHSKTISTTRVKSATKQAAENSPLANNRFYELSTKTPDTEESRSLRAHQGAIPKRKIATASLAVAAASPDKDDSMGTFFTFDAHSQNHVHKKLHSKKQTDLFGTYLNVDGTRSQITNWQRNINLGPIWEPSSIYASRRILPQPRPIVILPPAPLRRIESYCNFYKKNSRHSNNNSSTNNNCSNACANLPPKIAPLRNLCDPGREIWVSKAEFANSNTQRCVKILPTHHKCAGVERRITPNDVDVKDIACKLEKHERLPKPGTRTTPCTCFRPTRRSFCMNCKTNLIGRPFRKCRKHPDIGFSTDHFYCPFCLADAMLLKEI